MVLGQIGFLLGAFSSLWWTYLPPVWLTIILTILGFGCLFHRKLALFAGFLFAVLWYTLAGYQRLGWQLPATLVSTDILVSAEVISLMPAGEQAPLNAQLLSINGDRLATPIKVRLSNYDPDILMQQGQRWQWVVRLKPIHGLANEGGFRYQQWMFSEGIRARGYIRGHQDNRLLDDHITLRQRLLNSLEIAQLPSFRWIAALTLGYRGALEQADWHMLQRTGLAHLVAISGLHLGFVGVMSYAVLAWLFSLPGKQTINAHQLAWFTSPVFVALYSALAGFSLPTLRALIAYCLIVLMMASRRYRTPAAAFLTVVVILLLISPLSIYTASFWLSFSAVSALLLIHWRWPFNTSAFMQFVGLQVLLTLLMLPVVGWQFGILSPLSIGFNLLAIPIVMLLLVPGLLCAVLIWLVLPATGITMFSMLDGVITLLIEGMSALDTLLAEGAIRLTLPWQSWLYLLVMTLLVIIPTFRWRSGLIGLCFISMVLHGLSVFIDTRQHWQLTVLDSGQGMAVVLMRNKHAILYDVGASYSDEFDIADSVVLPFLRHNGVRQIDYLFISHLDNDHAGALPALLASEFKVPQIITSQNGCDSSLSLKWQGLHLRGLWPPTPASSLQSGENRYSCVLMLQDSAYRILLTGDIDQVAERYLADSGVDLRANVLVAPHHGSKTSSTQAFVEAISPQHVIFSSGFLNRWQHPHGQVMLRYAGNDARIHRTDLHGQISVYVEEGDIQVRRFRESGFPYWYANSQ